MKAEPNKLKGSDYYDSVYAKTLGYLGPASESPSYRLWRKVIDYILKSEYKNVLELGCGTGQLAKMIVGAGVGYTGVDFSPYAIKVCRGRFNEGEAKIHQRDIESFMRDYGCFNYDIFSVSYTHLRAHET